MKYFSEDNGCINAECENCNRVLKIKKSKLTTSDNGFLVNNPSGIKCICGTVHNNILGCKIKPTFKYISQEDNQNKKGENKEIFKVLVWVAIIFVAIPTLIIGSCVRSCKNEHAEIVNRNKDKPKTEYQTEDEWRKEKFLKSTPEEVDAKGGLTNEEAKWLLEEAKKQGY